VRHWFVPCSTNATHLARAIPQLVLARNRFPSQTVHRVMTVIRARRRMLVRPAYVPGQTRSCARRSMIVTMRGCAIRAPGFARILPEVEVGPQRRAMHAGKPLRASKVLEREAIPSRAGRSANATLPARVIPPRGNARIPWRTKEHPATMATPAQPTILVRMVHAAGQTQSRARRSTNATM